MQLHPLTGIEHPNSLQFRQLCYLEQGPEHDNVYGLALENN